MDLTTGRVHEDQGSLWTSLSLFPYSIHRTFKKPPYLHRLENKDCSLTCSTKILSPEATACRQSWRRWPCNTECAYWWAWKRPRAVPCPKVDRSQSARQHRPESRGPSPWLSVLHHPRQRCAIHDCNWDTHAMTCFALRPGSIGDGKREQVCGIDQKNCASDRRGEVRSAVFFRTTP